MAAKKAARPATAGTPLVSAAELEVELYEEKKRKQVNTHRPHVQRQRSVTHAGALVELPVPVVDADAPEVAEPVAEVEAEMSVLVRVTPTDSHVSWAKATALVRSSPEQLVSMQEVTEEMKAEFVQRHLLSVDEQPPMSMGDIKMCRKLAARETLRMPGLWSSTLPRDR